MEEQLNAEKERLETSMRQQIANQLTDLRTEMNRKNETLERTITAQIQSLKEQLRTAIEATKGRHDKAIAELGSFIQPSAIAPLSTNPNHFNIFHLLHVLYVDEGDIQERLQRRLRALILKNHSDRLPMPFSKSSQFLEIFNERSKLLTKIKQEIVDNSKNLERYSKTVVKRIVTECNTCRLGLYENQENWSKHECDLFYHDCETIKSQEK